MSAVRPGASIAHVLAAWPLLGTVYRIALVADEALPVARRGLKLVRAEARLARESIPIVLWATVVAFLGLWILLGALAAGAVVSLAAAGWPLAWAVALPTAVGLLALIGGCLFVWRGVEHLTFVQSRARLHALLDMFDED